MIATATILATMLTGAAPVSYDCQAEKQLVLMSNEGKWSYNPTDLDREGRDTFRWTFVLQDGDDGSLMVSHDPGILDTVGVGGEYSATVIAPGQFAFATHKAQNCLFTELACGAMVEISDIDEKKASFSLVPMGSVMKADGSREILQVIMLGTCKKNKVKT